MRDLVYRRHQAARYKRRAKAFLARYHELETNPVTEEDIRRNNRTCGLRYHSRKNCSCAMCGNPRHYYTAKAWKHHRDLVEDVRFESALEEL